MTAPYPAALYALVHRGSAGDVAFYREQCEGSTSVLELGSGYGRILEALTKDGHRVVGLERDAALVAIAQDRSREREWEGRPGFAIVRGDMRHFGFDQSFDRILIPFTGIYCLTSRADCLSCLRCCAEHLSVNGRLIFDAYPADALQDDLDHHNEAAVLGEEFDPIVSVEWEGDLYDVYEQSKRGSAPQTLDVTYRYEARAGDSVIEGRIGHRYWLRDQIGPLLEEAGLRVLGVHGDFSGGPLCEDSENLVVIAERA